jgi:hypothetical protein
MFDAPYPLKRSRTVQFSLGQFILVKRTRLRFVFRVFVYYQAWYGLLMNIEAASRGTFIDVKLPSCTYTCSTKQP